nr:hypothetical protein [Tanacetum cinerariifolium]
MAKLAFCDNHNMVAILEKTEHNTDFHQIVDFLEASHIRGTIRISQSKVPSPRADDTAFKAGDDRYGEAFLTDTSLDAGQDRENIAKTSAMLHEALLRVTSLGGGKDNEMSHVLGSLGAVNILASGGLREQAKRDSEIARIHAEKELEMIISDLDRSNNMVTKLSVPTADIYIAKKLATVEDFALLHEDTIYSESKMRVCYI